MYYLINEFGGTIIAACQQHASYRTELTKYNSAFYEYIESYCLGALLKMEYKWKL